MAHIVEDDLGNREIKGEVIATTALHAAIATSESSFAIVARGASDAARANVQEIACGKMASIRCNLRHVDGDSSTSRWEHARTALEVNATADGRVSPSVLRGRPYNRVPQPVLPD